MISLSSYPNIVIDGQLIFSTSIEVFGFKDEALWKSAADRYETAVGKLFREKLDRSATGKAVLRAIRRVSPLTMVVKPRLNFSYDSDKDVYKPSANAQASKKMVRRGGGETIIFFTPAHFVRHEITDEVAPLKSLWTGKPAKVLYPDGPGALPDEVLLHEVFHGLRYMSGFCINRNVPFQRGYDDFEEFYAILVANIYRSERGEANLRADHANFETLASIGIHNQSDFYNYKLNKLHLKKLHRQQPSLFAELRAVKATFNPLTLVVP